MTGRRTYFFLSYAHVPPNQERTPSDPADTAPDYWVSIFFEDLSREVAELVGPDTDQTIGFYDPLLPAGSNWKAQLARQLGTADVFVALYSPRYLTWSWPRTERYTFGRRLAEQDADPAAGNIQPVLWTPIPWTDDWPDSDRALALSLGEGITEYGENGLRALRMLNHHRPRYDEIVRRLARRIVHASDASPLTPTDIAPLQAHRLATEPDGIEEDRSRDTPFVVAVLAPSTGSVPAGRESAAYGATARDWRPFRRGEGVPVAELAANHAERLGLPAVVVDLEPSKSPFERAPGLLLVDPWIAADEAGQEELRARLAELPDWVLTVVVVDPADGQSQRGAALADLVIGMLAGTEPPRVRDARGIDEFDKLVPFLVTQTRGKYLVTAPVFPPTGALVERPRLGRPLASAEGDR
jgi:FxsC-like protein